MAILHLSIPEPRSKGGYNGYRDNLLLEWAGKSTIQAEMWEVVTSGLASGGRAGDKDIGLSFLRVLG